MQEVTIMVLTQVVVGATIYHLMKISRNNNLKKIKIEVEREINTDGNKDT